MVFFYFSILCFVFNEIEGGECVLTAVVSASARLLDETANVFLCERFQCKFVWRAVWVFVQNGGVNDASMTELCLCVYVCMCVCVCFMYVCMVVCGCVVACVVDMRVYAHDLG
jgi:hypothetical protein